MLFGIFDFTREGIFNSGDRGRLGMHEICSPGLSGYCCTIGHASWSDYAAPNLILGFGFYKVFNAAPHFTIIIVTTGDKSSYFYLRVDSGLLPLKYYL